MNNNTSDEIWKDIEGYEGLYVISNKGNVFSFLSNKILKRYCASNGYENVKPKKRR
jgi:NUMOD4 motif